MLNLPLDHIAEKFPLKAGLIFEDESYTYADLLSRSQNLAASLCKRGIKPK
jgi:non-ribosomal peptide synthetase component E (peptide arylation enzyme)